MFKVSLSVTAVLVLFLVVPTELLAGEATFKEFYKDSPIPGWPTWLIAGIVTIAAATAVVLTAGAAAGPLVATFGTWIGGTMGLSGAAATSAGLALLGGGSIASGGFGMVGGATLVTAAMTFSTDLALAYTIEHVVSEATYRRLSEESKQLPTLPVPINEAGPDSSRAALLVLESIKEDEPLVFPENQAVIGEAIRTLQYAGTDDAGETSDPEDLAVQETLLSLLHFIANDYEKTNEHAAEAMRYARYSTIKYTLPSFLLATSSLYDESFNREEVTEHLRYSVVVEPNNPLIPLLFSIYLDRLALAYDDELDADLLHDVLEIMMAPEIEHLRLINFQTILARHFIQLKLRQQEISILTGTSNSTIRNSPKTLGTVEDALTRYSDFITSARHITKEMLFSEDALSAENRDKLMYDYDLLERYAGDYCRLAALVDEFRASQTGYDTSDVCPLEFRLPSEP